MFGSVTEPLGWLTWVSAVQPRADNPVVAEEMLVPLGGFVSTPASTQLQGALPESHNDLFCKVGAGLVPSDPSSSSHSESTTGQKLPLKVGRKMVLAPLSGERSQQAWSPPPRFADEETQTAEISQTCPRLRVKLRARPMFLSSPRQQVSALWLLDF